MTFKGRLPAIIILFFSLSLHASASGDSVTVFQKSPQPDKTRRHLVNYTFAGMYGLSMAWLYTQWYKDYPQSSFHYFNDNSEWEQVDKVAHCWNTYTFSKILTRCYEWTGMEQRKASWLGMGIGLFYQTSIEVFDGFNSEWGFSGGDMLANITGAGIFMAQQLSWHEQRIVLKYSFHQTRYEKYRPDLLGKNLQENMLKDYNGLTQWLTINPASFIKSSAFPSWLSFAIGYGAEGMTGGMSNPELPDGTTFERYRQYYFSVDLDLSRIETRSRILNSIFKAINFIHLPAPAIELSAGRKPVYHLLYF